MIIAIFILSLLTPIYFYVGPLRLSPYRLMLLVMLVPCVIAWVSGKLGPIRAPDILMLLSALWSCLALFATAGAERALQPAGILFIEAFGAYILGRYLIRTKHDFNALVGAFFWTILVLLPFAVVEALTSRAVILDALRRVVMSFPRASTEPRFGIARAQVVFEHPILYGVFCASIFGLVYFGMSYKRGNLGRLFRSGLVVAAAFLSMSSGAISTLMVQFILVAWDYMTRSVRNRWRLLGLLCVAAYITVDLLSNRTPFHVFVTYLTFSTRSAYNRILIWNFGSAEVLRHPIFGIGLGDWERPGWMSSSMDNFWLVVAVRYGLPAFLFLAVGLFLLLRGVGRMQFADEEIKTHRMALLVTLGGLIVAGCTVHYWNAIYCLFIFLIGCAGWMLNAEAHRPSVAASARTPPSSRLRMGAERLDAVSTRRV